MKLMDFLFGKKPNIFNKTGKVEHQLKENAWSEWKNRYIQGKEYNWKKHSGMRYVEDKKSAKK